MGNRAVIAINRYDEINQDSIGFYLHWNGGRDSVEAFLEATKQLMGDRLGDAEYGTARLAQVIGTYMGGNLSFGIDLCKNLDCDNGDNGVYVVDTATMAITDRRHHHGPEQDKCVTTPDPNKILKAIDTTNFVWDDTNNTTK
jgi:hypothetical protein